MKPMSIGEQLRSEVDTLVAQLKTALSETIEGIDHRATLPGGAEDALMALEEERTG